MSGVWDSLPDRRVGVKDSRSARKSRTPDMSVAPAGDTSGVCDLCLLADLGMSCSGCFGAALAETSVSVDAALSGSLLLSIPLSELSLRLRPFNFSPFSMKDLSTLDFSVRDKSLSMERVMCSDVPALVACVCSGVAWRVDRRGERAGGGINSSLELSVCTEIGESFLVWPAFLQADLSGVARSTP